MPEDTDIHSLSKNDVLSTDGNYPHLVKYLKQISRFSDYSDAFKEQIDQMPFSKVAQIVLEMRDAVIKHGKSGIERLRRGGTENQSPKIVFIIGNIAVGKSTVWCFLRGDEMRSWGIDYVSLFPGYIGSPLDLARSHTLLPNIEKVNDLILVDFAGFSDTNDRLTDLGTELALKALLKEYPSQILVLESIEDSERRYQSVANLNDRLDRLIINKKKACILGLTRYSHHEQFTKIMVMKYNQVQQQQLGKLQQDDAESSRHLENIAKIEIHFLEKIGLDYLIRFDDLKNTRHKKSCIKKLASFSQLLNPAEVNIAQELDYFDRNWLKEKFNHEFLKQRVSRSDSDEKSKIYADFDTLKQAIPLKSFIYAVEPEIGEFLHLPEMDPNLVKEFDKEIISKCVKKYIKAIAGFSISFFFESLKEVDKTQEVTDLQNRLSRLQHNVRSLLGFAKDEVEWKKYQCRCWIKDSDEEMFKLPRWIKALSYINTKAPTNLYSLKKYFVNQIGRSKQIPATISLQECGEEIKRLSETLTELNKIAQLLSLSFSLKKEDQDQNRQPELSPLYSVFQQKDLTLAKVLIEKGADVNETLFSDGTTLLHYACEDGHIDQIQFLLNHGANINAKRIDAQAATPSSLAVSNKHWDVVEFMVKQRSLCDEGKKQLYSVLIASKSKNKKLTAFNDHLNQLLKVEKSLKNAGFTEAAAGMAFIHNKISDYALQYYEGKIDGSKFKLLANNTVTENLDQLQHYPGWQLMKAGEVIINLLLVISLLVIGYGVLAAVKNDLLLFRYTPDSKITESVNDALELTTSVEMLLHK